MESKSNEVSLSHNFFFFPFGKSKKRFKDEAFSFSLLLAWMKKNL